MNKKLTYDWNPERIPNQPLSRVVLLNKQDIRQLIQDLLPLTNHNIGHPLESSKQLVIFDSRIADICNEFFDEVKKIKQNDKILAAYLDSRLFESFTSYWKNELLAQGKHIVGIGFWQRILSIAKRWEEKNNIKIHKGTPYFFLAETYLLIGDFDNGFIAMYNAIEDDKELPELGYPKNAPVYWTATMLNKPNNHMYYFIVRELRLKLSKFVQNYCNNYNQNFRIETFDQKFLMNDNLSNTVYFFVYNFFFIHELEKNNHYKLLQNEFLMIRTLDLVFNLAIFIDEILKFSASQKGFQCKSMFESIKWWACEYKKWITPEQLKNLIGPNCLKLNDEIPDIVIPILLENTKQSQGDYRKELHTMLLAYHLRNHGGHNLDQQKILVSEHDKIIESLFMAIFLAIETL